MSYMVNANPQGNNPGVGVGYAIQQPTGMQQQPTVMMQPTDMQPTVMQPTIMQPTVMMPSQVMMQPTVMMPGGIMVVQSPVARFKYLPHQCLAKSCIVLSVFAPYGCLSFVEIYRSASVALVIMTVLIQAALTVMCCLSLRLPNNQNDPLKINTRPAIGARRWIIFAVCLVCSIYYFLSIIIFGAIYGEVRKVYNPLLSLGSYGYSYLSEYLARYYAVLALFVIDMAFKIPLIVNSALLAVKIVKNYT